MAQELINIQEQQQELQQVQQQRMNAQQVLLVHLLLSESEDILRQHQVLTLSSSWTVSK